MFNLHWHTDESPCLLCGVPVTPEAWDGGVIEGPNRLGYGILQLVDHDPGFSGLPPGPALAYYDSRDKMLRYFGGATERPIFPPRGWAGKTDAELMGEISGNPYGCWVLRQDIDDDLRETTYRCNVYVRSDGEITTEVWKKFWGDRDIYGLYVNPKKLILALQNAMVLRERLEAKDGA